MRTFTEHALFIYASAIAFRALVALVPLALLGLGLLGALGLKDVWVDDLAPVIQHKVSPPVFAGIEYSIEKILNSSTAGLIAFAGLLLIWDLMLAVTAIMAALNRIHDSEETRVRWLRLGIAIGLALVIAVCLVGAWLAVTAGPKLGDGTADIVLGIGRWLVAVMLLGFAVGLLVRYAPAEKPEARWASAGTILIVATWIGVSLFFRWWVGSVADFKSAIGSLTVFLVLTTYMLVSASIFLIGVQLDELLRAAGGRKR
jgi:membrane protein